MSLSEISSKLALSNQSHLLEFYNELSTPYQESLLNQLSSIDFERCNRIFRKAVHAPEKTLATLEPLPSQAFHSLFATSESQKTEWRDLGLKQIASNKVAVILLAGGQGSRLGSSQPKGCFDIMLPSHKSLFQIQAERIIRVQCLAAQMYPQLVCKEGVIIPWYIMTSGPTRKETEQFFKSHGYFGLQPNNILFFNQGVLPAFSNEGRILLAEKSSVCLAPDGNGGIYAALREEGVLDDLEKRGIPYIHAYCVDNCLVKVADPLFIGFCIEAKVECGAKAVPKRSPHEPVGVICKRNGKFSVVEYSEIDASTANLVGKDGQLVYRAGNIANHFYTIDFLKRIPSFESELEYHIARKAIKHIDIGSGAKIDPKSANGIKLELFIFDVFPFTNSFAVLETSREEEFSPLKNATGSDSPETSRKSVLEQCARFARNAGAVVSTDEFEISPLVTYEGEGLEKLKGLSFTETTILNKL